MSARRDCPHCGERLSCVICGDAITQAHDTAVLNHWRRLFNSLEKAVTDHKRDKAGMFEDDADEALHRKHKTIMGIACRGPNG